MDIKQCELTNAVECCANLTTDSQLQVYVAFCISLCNLVLYIYMYIKSNIH